MSPARRLNPRDQFLERHFPDVKVNVILINVLHLLRTLYRPMPDLIAKAWQPSRDSIVVATPEKHKFSKNRGVKDVEMRLLWIGGTQCLQISKTEGKASVWRSP